MGDKDYFTQRYYLVKGASTNEESFPRKQKIILLCIDYKITHSL